MVLDYIKRLNSGEYRIQISNVALAGANINTVMNELPNTYKSLDWFISTSDDCLNILIGKHELDTLDKISKFIDEINEVKK